MNDVEAFRWFLPNDPPPTSSLTEGCWDWPGPRNKRTGYGMIQTTVGGERGNYSAHIVSHKIFRGPTNKLSVLHSCDRPICVQPAHLRLGTTADNAADMVERGRSTFGERSASAKLSEAEVREILAIEDLSQSAIARRYGVSRELVGQIRRREKWKHL